jgi:8-oxo-dGTP pyrophosphatase MutT (NUDIX family)
MLLRGPRFSCHTRAGPDATVVRAGRVKSVELPDGKHFDQYVFRLPRCAMTAVLDEAGENILLIWRHRFIVDQWDWEVPGGYADPGEDGLTTAAREVGEETGWRAAQR